MISVTGTDAEMAGQAPGSDSDLGATPSSSPFVTPFDRFLGRESSVVFLNRGDLLAMAVFYVLLVAVYFGPMALRGHILSHPEGDIAVEWWWKRNYLGEALREGHLPIMNPFMMSNVPYLASNQTAVFYPFNWLFGSMSAVFLLNLQTILHFWAGMAFMHVLARRLGRSVCASVMAALVFGFSGFAILHWWQGHLVFVLEWPWTPLAVWAWAVLQTRAGSGPLRRGLAPFLALSFVLTLQFFSGHPQISYFTLLILAALHGGWLLWAAIGTLAERRASTGQGEQPRGGKGAMRAALIGSLWLIAAGLLTGGLSAVQALPTLAFSGESVRGEGISLQDLQLHSLPLSQSPLLVAPWAFGGAYGLPYLASSVVRRVYWEVSPYVGAVTVALAVAAMLLGGRGRGLRWTLFLTAVGAWWLALGMYGGLHGALVGVVPGFSMFRCPARFGYVLGFAVALLAAGGLDEACAAARSHLESRRRTFRRTILALAALIGGAVVLFFLLFPKGGDSPLYRAMLWEQPLAFGPLKAEFYHRYFGAYLSELTMAAMITAGVIVLLVLLTHHRLHRLAPVLIVVLLTVELLRFAWSYRDSFPVEQIVWPEKIRRVVAAEGSRWKYSSVRAPSDYCHGLMTGVGHIWGADPLVVRRYAAVLAPLERFFQQGRVYRLDRSFESPMMKALGLRWMIAPAGAKSEGSAWKQVASEGDVALFEHPGAIPRGFLVPASRTASPGQNIVPLLTAADFEPTRTVLLLEPPPPGAPSVEGGAASDLPLSGTVEFLRDAPEHLEVKVETERAAWFVLMDQPLPGWSATVDGIPAKIYVANGIGRALPVAPGSHRIEMTYRAPGLRTGAWISAVAWLLWTGGAMACLLLRRRSRWNYE